MRLKVGIRPSRLARVQALEALEHLRMMGLDCIVELVAIASDGDIDKTTPLSRTEGSDFFTRQIEEALVAGRIDMAVHSAKDLEDDTPPETEIVVLTPSLSAAECLVSRTGCALEMLPSGSVVGTSSIKRTRAVQAYRTDLVLRDIRGTIEERLAQLDAGKYDALVMAHAALLRLGLTGRPFQLIPPEIMPPHPLQGRLAVQVRRADPRFDRVRAERE